MVKKKESGGVYYSSGEFARMAQITVRTVRYYDKQNILKTVPCHADRGAFLYGRRFCQTAADHAAKISWFFVG